MTRIESNGLLFGVSADSAYPVRDVSFARGDRVLLYTDGVVEPENASGEAFGDCKLEDVLKNEREKPAQEISKNVLAELRAWQPRAVSQQDDITLIVIDFL